jgi:hypothetical protein
MANRPLVLTRAVRVSLCHFKSRERSARNPKTDFAETGDWILYYPDILGKRPRSIVLMIWGAGNDCPNIFMESGDTEFAAIQIPVPPAERNCAE